MSLFFIFICIIYASTMAAGLSIMASFSMSYGHLFDFVKISAAKHFFKNQKEQFQIESDNESITHISQIDWFLEKLKLYKTNPMSKASEDLNGIYDQIAHKNFLVGVLDCPYCMGQWISLFIYIPISLFIWESMGLDFCFLNILQLLIVLPTIMVFTFIITIIFSK